MPQRIGTWVISGCSQLQLKFRKIFYVQHYRVMPQQTLKRHHQLINKRLSSATSSSSAFFSLECQAFQVFRLPYHASMSLPNSVFFNVSCTTGMVNSDTRNIYETWQRNSDAPVGRHQQHNFCNNKNSSVDSMSGHKNRVGDYPRKN